MRYTCHSYVQFLPEKKVILGHESSIRRLRRVLEGVHLDECVPERVGLGDDVRLLGRGIALLPPQRRRDLVRRDAHREGADEVGDLVDLAVRGL